METCLRKLSIVIAAICIFFVAASAAHAQQVDLAFGYGTVSGNPATDGDGGLNHQDQSIKGGGYPAFIGDFIFYKNLGVGGEAAWRAHQNVDIFFQPYRPILFDVNVLVGTPGGFAADAEVFV